MGAEGGGRIGASTRKHWPASLYPIIFYYIFVAHLFNFESVEKGTRF